MDNYERLSQAGEGTYGVVLKARHKHSGMIVAIKRFKEKDEDGAVRKTALREVRILRQLHHENIVNLIEVFRQGGKLYLVFEFVDGNVLDEMERHQPAGLPAETARRITWQVLRSIEHCHANNIMHRDIKPENLLVTKSGTVKLCDFGFAREMDTADAPGYTDYVATRWYRSPELLVGARDYTRSVDVWAIGTLFAEMVSGAPLFPGETDLDQLHRIIRVLGPLTQYHRDTFSSNPLYEGIAIPSLPSTTSTTPVPEEEEAEDEDDDVDKHQSSVTTVTTSAPTGLAARLPGLGPKELSFLSRCLGMTPGDRSSCSELLKHEYFDAEWVEKVPAELHSIAERERTELITCLKRAKRLDTSLLRHLLGSSSPATEQLSAASGNVSSTTSSPGGSGSGPGTAMGSPAAVRRAEKRTSLREDLFASSAMGSTVPPSAKKERVSFAGAATVIPDAQAATTAAGSSPLRFPQLPATPRAVCAVAAPRTSFEAAATSSNVTSFLGSGRHRRPPTPGSHVQQSQPQSLFPLATEYSPSMFPAVSQQSSSSTSMMAVATMATSMPSEPLPAAAIPSLMSRGPKASRTVVPITATKSLWGPGNSIPGSSSSSVRPSLPTLSQSLQASHLRKLAGGAASLATSGTRR